MAKRTYSSPRRSAEAAQTRQLILDAVSTLCGRDGYTATTLKAIAAEAGVSIQSVTLAGSKASLLIAAFERSFSGNEGRESLTARPAVAEIMGQPDTTEAIRQWVDYVTDANERTAGLARAMVAAAEIDPLAADVVADLEDRRRSDMQLAAGWLAGRELLPPREIPRVADELGYLVGHEAYAYFVTLRAWNKDDYRNWLIRSVGSLITAVTL